MTVGVVDVGSTAANDVDRDERRPHNVVNTVEQHRRENVERSSSSSRLFMTRVALIPQNEAPRAGTLPRPLGRLVRSERQDGNADRNGLYLGRLPVSEVNTTDVLEILTPIWQSRRRRHAPCATHPVRAGGGDEHEPVEAILVLT